MAEVFAAPARYAQGPGVAATLGDEMTRLGLGGPVLVLAGASAVRQLGAIWGESLGRGGFAPAIHPFGGECSRREIAAVAAELDLDIISYPTIASTDAPTSAISVVSSDSGVVEKVAFGTLARPEGRHPPSCGPSRLRKTGLFAAAKARSSGGRHPAGAPR